MSMPIADDKVGTLGRSPEDPTPPADICRSGFGEDTSGESGYSVLLLLRGNQQGRLNIPINWKSPAARAWRSPGMKFAVW